MGSVKKIIFPGQGPGGELYRRPTPRTIGRAAWDVGGYFSVGDMKTKIPRLEIRGKAEILAITASRYWEDAANSGFMSSYEGMLDARGNIVDTRTLLDRGELSRIVVMNLAMTPPGKKITVQSLARYDQRISDGEIRNYIPNVESIFRRGVPLGSSVFKRIFAAAGMADQYEHLATYAEVFSVLEKIRAIPGIIDKPEMMKVLKDAGLYRIPNPGFCMSRPVIGYTTKFDPAGDKDLTTDEAARNMHLDHLRSVAWWHTLLANEAHQYEFCKALGILSIDGKLETMVVNDFPVFADFACTIDENRLMLRYLLNGKTLLIPTNKEIQRAIFRLRGIYAAKEAAMRDHGDDWLDHLGQYVTDQKIKDATVESIELMEQAIGTVGNLLLGQNVFEADPIEKWVGAFLPYASVEEHELAA